MAKTVKKPTAKQREMLVDFLRDGEATDLCAFEHGKRNRFAWRNRESVIESCWRRGWLDDEGITDTGRAAIAS